MVNKDVEELDVEEASIGGKSLQSIGRRTQFGRQSHVTDDSIIPLGHRMRYESGVELFDTVQTTSVVFAISSDDLICLSRSQALREVGKTELAVGASNYGVDLDDHIAYVASISNGLYAVDVSDPTAPTVVDSLTIADGPRKVTIDHTDKIAYCTTDSASVYAVDISDPANLSALSDATHSNLGVAYESSLRGGYLFVASGHGHSPAGTGGLTVFDVSDPSAISSVTTLNTADLTNTYGSALIGDYWVTASGHDDDESDNYNTFVSVDVSDPESPTQADTLTDANISTPYGMVEQGSIVYAADKDANAIQSVRVGEEGSLSLVDVLTDTRITSPYGVDAIGESLSYAQRAGTSAGVLGGAEARANCYAYLSTAQTGLASGEHEVQFDARLPNGDPSQILDTSSGYFFVPTDGDYHVSAAVKLSSLTSGDAVQMRLYADGVQHKRIYETANRTSKTLQIDYTVPDLAAGDRIRLKVYLENGGAIDSGSTPYQTTCEVRRV